MHLGHIEPIEGQIFTRDWWEGEIVKDKELCLSIAREGINPFTREPMVYEPNPSTAIVYDQSTKIGSIEWAQDGSDVLIVWAEKGHESSMRSWTEGLATRLFGVFVYEPIVE